MADIFISYAKDDQPLAQSLSAWLEAQGWTTWWITNQLGDNKAREPILAELNKSRVVVVLWSKASIASPFVVHQAIAGRDAHKLLDVIVPGFQREHVPLGLRGRSLLKALDQRVIETAVDAFAKELKSAKNST
jgi:TIR domain